MKKGGTFEISLVTDRIDFGLWLTISFINLALGYFLISNFLEQRLEIITLDIGQGDSILIKTPLGQKILIDGGPSAKRLREKLPNILSPTDTTIDYVIVSHHDSDHVGGLLGISKSFDIKNIIDPEISYSKDPKNKKWLQEIMNTEAKIIYPRSNKDLIIEPGIYIDFIFPMNRWDDPKLKNESLVFILHFGKNSFYFGGDSEEPQERIMLASGKNLEADHYKVSHHGSKTSSSVGLLQKMNPDTAFMSYGHKNRYRHPHSFVVQRLQSLKIPTYGTGGSGNIIYKCDLKFCSVFKENKK